MSSTYAPAALPPEFENLLQQFPLDSDAQIEIENLIGQGLRQLNDVGVMPRDAVYHGAITDLKYFLEQAQREAFVNGRPGIDLQSIQTVQLRIPHIWPFF